MKGLKRAFSKGLLGLVPKAIIAYLLYLLFEFIFSLVQPWTVDKLPLDLLPFPLSHIVSFFLTLSVVLVVITLAGYLSYLIDRSFLLGLLRSYWIKGKNYIYRKIIEAKGKGKVVIISRYGQDGGQELALFEEFVRINIQGKDKTVVKVAIPSAPIPISGMSVLLEPSQVFLTDLNLEEFIAQLTTFGLAAIPRKIEMVRLDHISPETLQKIFGSEDLRS